MERTKLKNSLRKTHSFIQKVNSLINRQIICLLHISTHSKVKAPNYNLTYLRMVSYISENYTSKFYSNHFHHLCLLHGLPINRKISMFPLCKPFRLPFRKMPLHKNIFMIRHLFSIWNMHALKITVQFISIGLYLMR